MTGPARITIELEPDARRGRWRTRTRVEGSRWSRRGPTTEPEGVAQAMPVHVPEPREPAVVLTAYEPPAECTCVDGFCEADHEND